MDRLLRLSTTLDKPAPDDEYGFSSKSLTQHQALNTEEIQAKYTSMTDEIAQRLCSALSRRGQYFEYRRHQYGHDGQHLVDGGKKVTTEANIVAPANIAAEADNSKNERSSDGDSDISGTSYAVSDAQSSNGGFPPMPKEFTIGPSKCPFCHSILSIGSQDMWKYVHLLLLSQALPIIKAEH